MDMSLDMCKSVRRGAPSTFLVGDMPFGSYEISDKQAVKNAISFVKNGNVDSIKLEGGERITSRVKAISDAGIIVFGHIGLTPQSVSSFGGYKVQGKSLESLEGLISDAIKLQQSGASAILLEAVPEICSRIIKENVSIPIFGIGAGGRIDGQLLIAHDVMGLYPDFKPRFAKNYLNIVLRNLFNDSKNKTIDRKNEFTSMEIFTKAFEMYDFEVKKNLFPCEKYCYPISDEELKKIKNSKYFI
jgi:3-methyl-2-oxobutanoate hydroxymethyltransferase